MFGRLAILPLLGVQTGPEAHVTKRPDDVPAPVIDGRLDDPLWERCVPIGELTQVVPVAGATPSERTEVRLAVDEDALYIALRCYDRDLPGIRDTQMRRDANLDPDDRVEFLIDTFDDDRNAYWFQIGPAGSKGDALLAGDGTRFNKQWNGLWYGRARIDAEGWTAELAIPAATIDFEPTTTSWGFNLRRFVRRRSEEARWAAAEPRLSFFSASQAGTIHGVRGLDQGVGLDVIPYGLTRFEHQDGDSDLTGDVGLDLFYNLTPSTKLSLSFNTDFAETEVDTRQINLTRFPLFFPEKRKFFLEDSSVFEFGRSGSRDVTPFFSRRIGIDENGEIVPLLFAGKLTGRTDDWSFGVLDVQTQSTDDVDSQNLFSGRVQRNLFTQSDVGVTLTHGDPNGATTSTTFGADVHLRTDSFLGDRNLRFTSYALRTESSDAAAEGDAWFAGVSYPNDEVQVDANYTEIDEGFDPKLGFVPRAGIRRADGGLGYRPRLYSSVRRLLFSVDPSWTRAMTGTEESVTIAVQPFGVEWESGEVLSLSYDDRGETLDSDFEIRDGVIIPTGSYDFARYGVSFTTSDKRPVELRTSVTTGGFFDGDRTDWSAGIDLRTSKYALFGFDYNHNDVDLPGGAFTVNLARARIDFVFTPDISWSNYVQWDDVSDSLGVNSRLWWILQPGQQIFLVVDQAWDVMTERFAPTASEVTMKLSYTIRV